MQTCMMLLICSQPFPLNNFCISWLLSSSASGRPQGCSAWGDEVQGLCMLLEERRQLELSHNRSWALRLGLPWAQKALSWA